MSRQPRSTSSRSPSSEDSLAKTSRSRARAQDSTERAPASGPSSRESSTSAGREWSLLKTSRRLFREGWTELRVTSEGLAIECSLASSAPLTLAPRTDGSACLSSLWPTITARRYGTRNNGDPGDGRGEYATKGAASLETMASQQGGRLNPAWVECLMGFPTGWTDGPADPETLPLFGSLI